MHGEVHRAIHRRKARQCAMPSGKAPAPIIGEQHNPLITLRKQGHDIRSLVPSHIAYLEPDGAWTGIQYLPLMLRSIAAIKSESPTVVAVFADEKVVSTIPVEVKLLNEDRPEERVDQDSAESE